MSSWNEVSSGLRKPLGIVGGSGLDTFPELKILRLECPRTGYGSPSDNLVLAEHEGQPLAFLPRHGSSHSLSPHRIPYRANLAAMREMGVDHVVASCISGSLKEDIRPGSFVVPDQFVNLTWGRDCDPEEEHFVHLPMGDPYCPSMRRLLLEAARQVGVETLDGGTVVVIQGPRFSTKAESRWFSGNGWDLVNMTQYPECYFAREAGMCYAVLAAVTDYDVGLPSALSMSPQGMDKVLAVFRENVIKTRQILLRASALAGDFTGCRCAKETSLEYYKR